MRLFRQFLVTGLESVVMGACGGNSGRELGLPRIREPVSIIRSTPSTRSQGGVRGSRALRRTPDSQRWGWARVGPRRPVVSAALNPFGRALIGCPCAALVGRGERSALWASDARRWTVDDVLSAGLRPSWPSSCGLTTKIYNGHRSAIQKLILPLLQSRTACATTCFSPFC